MADSLDLTGSHVAGWDGARSPHAAGAASFDAEDFVQMTHIPPAGSKQQLLLTPANASSDEFTQMTYMGEPHSPTASHPLQDPFSDYTYDGSDPTLSTFTSSSSSAYPYNSSSSFPAFPSYPGSSSHGAGAPPPHLSRPTSAAARAAARRTDFFKEDLEKRAERVRRDKTRTPLSPEVVQLKQYRIQQIQKRIESLQQSHAAKKARVLASFEAVQRNYERFAARNAEVAQQGLEVVQKMEKVQERLHQEDLEEAEKELNSAQSLHEQRVATNLQSLPPATLGPNPQTTIRSLYSSDLPINLLATQRGGSSALATINVQGTVEVDGIRIQASAHPTSTAVLSDDPLPPQPALLSMLARSAVESMDAGDRIPRNTYALLQSAAQAEKKRSDRRAHVVQEEQGAFGVSPTASPEQRKEWVDQHVFGWSPKSAHAHSFPAPELPVRQKENDSSRSTTFSALQSEKKRYLTYVRVVKHAWDAQEQKGQVERIERAEERIQSVERQRNKARVQFEREKVVAMELVAKQRALLELKDVEASEAAARAAYRRRVQKILDLLQTDGMWKTDQGRQAMDALVKWGREPLQQASAGSNSAHWTDINGVRATLSREALRDPHFDVEAYLRAHPPSATPMPPHHALALAHQQARARAAGVGWREDLWERKEWSHQDDSSLEDRTMRASGSGSGATGRQHPLSPTAAAGLGATPPRSHESSPRSHSPPSPTTMRVARRRIQAAERDAQLSTALKKQTAERRQMRSQYELEEAEKDRQWLEERQKRIAAATTQQSDSSDSDDSPIGTTRVSFDARNLEQKPGVESIQQAYDAKKAEQRRKEQLLRDARPNQQEEDHSAPHRPHQIVISPASSIRADAYKSSPSVSSSAAQDEPRFTASTNRRALAEHASSPVHARTLHASASQNQHSSHYDPESDHKHIDPSSRSHSHYSHHDHLEQHTLLEHDDLGALDEEDIQDVVSPQSRMREAAFSPSVAGPSIPNLPPGGLPQLDPYSPSNVSQVGQLMQSMRRGEQISPSVAGPTVPTLPRGGLPPLNPLSPSSMSDSQYREQFSSSAAGRGGDLSEQASPASKNYQVSPASMRRREAQKPIAAKQTTATTTYHPPLATIESASTSVRSPGTEMVNLTGGREIGAGASTIAATSHHDSSFSLGGTTLGQSLNLTSMPSSVASSPQKIGTSPAAALQPPTASLSPKALPPARGKLGAPGSASKYATSSTLVPPASSNQRSSPVDGPSAVFRPARSSDEFAELFGTVDDFGESTSVDVTPAVSHRDVDPRSGQANQPHQDRSPYDGGAVETLRHSQASTVALPGPSSMRSSVADWDESNEGGDLEAFSEVHTGFYDHTTAPR